MQLKRFLAIESHPANRTHKHLRLSAGSRFICTGPVGGDLSGLGAGISGGGGTLNFRVFDERFLYGTPTSLMNHHQKKSL